MLSEMAVPRLPAFDAKAFSQRLYERVTSATGKPYAVFDPADDAGNPINFPRFTQALRDQRDIVARHDVQLTDHKLDIDRLESETSSLKQRVAALEAQSIAPFPAST